MKKIDVKDITSVFDASDGKFVFEDLVKSIYDTTVYDSTIKDIYKPKLDKNNNIVGTSSEATRKKGVYALFDDDGLRKIGQAADKSGIFHRMSQYYRGKDGRCPQINSNNRDSIKVKYFNMDDVEDCWAAERLLQSIAFYMGEKMPWEEKRRKSKGEQE